MSEPGVSIPARWLDPGAVVPVNAETVQLLLKMVANMEKNLNAQRDRAEASRVYAVQQTTGLQALREWMLPRSDGLARIIGERIDALLSRSPKPVAPEDSHQERRAAGKLADAVGRYIDGGCNDEEGLRAALTQWVDSGDPECVHETAPQPALGSLSSPQTGAPPERSETGQQIESKSPTRPRLQLGACAGCKQPIYGGQPHQMRHAGCEETDLRHQSGTKSPECVVCHRDPKSNPYGKCPAWNFMCPHQPATETARHQSGRDPLEAVRELLLDVQSLLDSKAYNLARDGVAGALMKVNEALRPQVVREPASPWIRGRDRLPTENDVRFAYRMHDDGPTYCVDNRGEFDSEFGTDGPPEQIVWMPLPTVPDDPADAVLVACNKQEGQS